jgi:hypothetical protein
MQVLILKGLKSASSAGLLLLVKVHALAFSSAGLLL